MPALLSQASQYAMGAAAGGGAAAAIILLAKVIPWSNRRKTGNPGPEVTCLHERLDQERDRVEKVYVTREYCELVSRRLADEVGDLKNGQKDLIAEVTAIRTDVRLLVEREKR